ncbi:MAG: hypothetical protein ACLRZZ_01840 [Enterocloster sp.]
MFPNHAKQWNHGSVCTARRGQWYASVTAGDYQYVKGSTPSGGTVTLLHEAVWGPVLAATMSEYRLSEPLTCSILCIGRLDARHFGLRRKAGQVQHAWMRHWTWKRGGWCPDYGQRTYKRGI